MKFLATAFITLLTPTTAQAGVTAQYKQDYQHAYHAVAAKFGTRAPGCNLFSSCHRRLTDAAVVHSLLVLGRMLHPPVAAARRAAPALVGASVASRTASQTLSYGGGYGSVPGVPSGFASCVARRESTNGAGSPNIYGLQSYHSGESLAQQKQVMADMYRHRGTDPWHRYDGC